MSSDYKTVLSMVKQALADYLQTVDPEEISETDHLAEDLLLELSHDIPKVVALIEQNHDLQFDEAVIHDFIREAVEEDDEKGTVGEFTALLRDEIAYNQ